jgi:hypothetical protein
LQPPGRALRARAATRRKQPRAAQDVQEQQGGRICPVRRSGHDEIFLSVGSGLPRRPITWIMYSDKGHSNLSLARHRTARPDPSGIRGKVETCTRSLDPTRLSTLMSRENPSWDGSRSYAALQRLPQLAQRTAPTGDEGPRCDTVPTLLLHCSRMPFYHLNPCTPALLEL